MYLPKSFLFCYMLFCSGYIYSQELDLRNVSFEKKKYEEIAKIELENRFYITSKYIDKIYLKDTFNFEDLMVYSIPIFDIKKNKTNFINSIDFSSNPNKQRVVIESIKNGKIVSEFSILDKKFANEEDDFSRIEKALLYYKYDYEDKIDLPILIGGPYKYFFTKERLEKKYFRFDVVGFRGTFILKNDEFFYVTKKIVSDKKIKKMSYEEETRQLKTIYLKVTPNFLKELKNELK